MLAAGHFMVLDVEGNATLCCASMASRANTIGNYLTMPIKAIQAARRSHPLTDRDTTLITLNALLTPDHEIRFCRETNGNDTVAFLPLPSAQWQSLETAFPKEVEAKFMKITADTQLFGE